LPFIVDFSSKNGDFTSFFVNVYQAGEVDEYLKNNPSVLAQLPLHPESSYISLRVRLVELRFPPADPFGDGRESVFLKGMTTMVSEEKHLETCCSNDL